MPTTDDAHVYTTWELLHNAPCKQGLNGSIFIEFDPADILLRGEEVGWRTDLRDIQRFSYRHVVMHFALM